MQPVEAAGGEKARHRVGAALDQDAAEATIRKRRQDRGRGDMPVLGLQQQCLDPIRQDAWRGAGGDEHQSANSVLGQKPGTRRQSAARVDHHPGRMRTGDAPHRELGIVGERGADADDDGIDQGPQPVKVRQGPPCPLM